MHIHSKQSILNLPKKTNTTRFCSYVENTNSLFGELLFRFLLLCEVPMIIKTMRYLYCGRNWCNVFLFRCCDFRIRVKSGKCHQILQGAFKETIHSIESQSLEVTSLKIRCPFQEPDSGTQVANEIQERVLCGRLGSFCGQAVDEK